VTVWTESIWLGYGSAAVVNMVMNTFFIILATVTFSSTLVDGLK
jgi:hypothetical protein